MVHICQREFAGLASMREFYAVNNMIATSTVADEALIRSHIAYHAGQTLAEWAEIRPSRGHSYKVNLLGRPKRQDWKLVRITNHYDHRSGVAGLFSASAVASGGVSHD
jgi:hypothetical protein